MNPKLIKRTGALAAAFAITGATAIACSQEAKDQTKDALSSATSAASSAVDAGTSKAKEGASSASSAVSSAVEGAPSTVNAPGVGEVVLDAPIAEEYSDAGGEAKLGLPTAQPEKVGDGTVQAFANGTIFSSPSTGTHVVQGEILRVYTATVARRGSWASHRRRGRDRRWTGCRQRRLDHRISARHHQLAEQG